MRKLQRMGRCMHLLPSWPHKKDASFQASFREYSPHVTLLTVLSVLARTAAASEQSSVPSSIKGKVPATPLSVTPSVSENASTSHATGSYASPHDHEQSECVAEELLSDGHGRSFYLGPSPTASFLSQATTNIGQLKGKFWDQNFQTNAESSLSELSKTFTAINFDESSSVRANVRTFRRNNEVFFIPEKDEGMMMMQSKLTLRGAKRPWC